MNRKPIGILFVVVVAIGLPAPQLRAEMGTDSDDSATVSTPAAVVIDEPTTTADLFVPDVFPSRAEATRAIARRWARSAGSVNGSAPPVSVLREGADVGTVTLDARSDGTDAGEAISARFVEERWLSDFAGFIAGQPASHWIVGRTPELHPAISPAEAARAARKSAVEEVERLVRARLPERVRRHDGGRIRGVVEASLVDGSRLVADRFPQKFERGYGTLYREAVLIDASDANLAPLTDQVIGSIRDHRQSRARSFLGSAVVLLAIYGAYRLANGATRGYFTWRLRTMAAVLAAGAVAVISALG